VKGVGGPQTHHGNEDAGSFTVDSAGEAFLIDPGYFQGTAMEHNLPLVGELRPVAAESGFNKGGAAVTAAPEGGTFNKTAPVALSDAWESGDLRSVSVDSTAAYKADAQGVIKVARVQRVFVMAGDKALVVLDNVQPTDPAAPITTLFQTGFPVTVAAESDSFRIEGKSSDLVGLLDGPKGTLGVEPMNWLNKWVFKERGVQWHRIKAPYAFDAKNPRLTVLLPTAKGATPPKISVERGDRQISVKIPGAPDIQFVEADGLWKSVNP
jgi:hypothetical protein